MARHERLHYLKKITALSKRDIAIIQDPLLAFNFDDANRMIENAIGMLMLPLGIATDFMVNSREYRVPMAIEEPSVIAAASKAAKIAKRSGGFTAEADKSLMIGQVQLLPLHTPKEIAKQKILSNKNELLHIANSKSRYTIAKDLGGKHIVERILYAYAFAYSDTHRAVTHNKGIMNGIDAAALATGQDFRAIEAGAHAYAARDGTYRSLTKWYKTEEGDLAGEIELPVAVGIVGGVVSVHPMAKIALKILGVKPSQELAMILAAAGLAQNLAAIRALASEGIQKGHMKLHARNIAVMAGAKGELIDIVARRISDENNININRAKDILSLLKKAHAFGS